MSPDIFLDSERETPSPTPSPSPYRCPDLGFHFTDDENRLMRLHCRAAAQFMKTYGQEPAQSQIDLSYYENSKPETQCQTRNIK